MIVPLFASVFLLAIQRGLLEKDVIIVVIVAVVVIFMGAARGWGDNIGQLILPLGHRLWQRLCRGFLPAA